MMIDVATLQQVNDLRLDRGGFYPCDCLVQSISFTRSCAQKLVRPRPCRFKV